MRINPFIYGVFVLVVFMGTILGFQAAGIWSVSGKITFERGSSPANCIGCQFDQRLDDFRANLNGIQCAGVRKS